MRLFPFSRFMLTFGVMLLAFSPALPTGAQQRERQGSVRLLASIPWDVGDQTLRCSIEEPPPQRIAGETYPVRVLTVRKEGQAPAASPLYEMKTMDGFVELIPTDGRNLITVWTGGSAYHFIVLSYRNGIVRIVLEAGSRTTLEIAHPGIRANSSLFALENSAWEPVLIVAGWCWETTKAAKDELHPCTANVYIWDEKSQAYRMESRSWEDRFRWPYSKAKSILVEHVFEHQ